MGMTPSQIGALLKKVGINAEFNEEDQYFVFSLGTEVFKDQDGDNCLLMAIDIWEDGEFLQFICPRLYNVKDCPNRAAVFEAALVMAWRTKSLGYEYHQDSGELRAVFEMPLEDGELTERQLARILKMVFDLVEAYDPVIRNAITAGEIDMSLAGSKEPEPGATKNREVEELIAELGGVDKLRELAAKNKTPGG